MSSFEGELVAKAETKICYISPVHQHIYRWMEAFAKKGYSTSLITDSNCWVAPQIPFSRVYTLPTLTKENSKLFLIPNILATTKLLSKIKPDLVHLHVQHYLSSAIILSRLPFILTSWGIEVMTLPQVNLLFRSWAKVTANKAKTVTVDAKFLKKIWVENGIPQNKVKVIPFGVDTNVFHPQVSGSAVKGKLGIADSDVVVISTRPFYNEHYDVESLIKAIPLVVEKHPSVKFIVKGSGPLETHLRKMAKKLKVDRHTCFVGVVPYEELAQYLSAAHIYVSTCAYDSTSVSLLEAMASGLAPIVTDTIGNREWINDEKNGFLFTPKNHIELAEKLNRLIESQSMRQAFGQRCVEEVQRSARWQKSVSEMEAIYRAYL